MEILTSVRRLYIRFKSLVNDSVYSFGSAALLLLEEVQNHTVPVRERRRIRVNILHVLDIDIHDAASSNIAYQNKLLLARFYVLSSPPVTMTVSLCRNLYSSCIKGRPVWFWDPPNFYTQDPMRLVSSRTERRNLATHPDPTKVFFFLIYYALPQSSKR